VYLSSKQKDLIRQKIEELLVVLREQVTLGAESSKPVKLDQALAGRVSRIDAIQQQKFAEANLSRARNRLNRLTSRLAQLETDDFGCCELCEQAIGIERLLVKPESVYCVNCQEKIE